MSVAIKMAVLVVIIQKKKKIARTRMGILDRQKKKKKRRGPGTLEKKTLQGKRVDFALVMIY